jgi:CubicO group peptidase (beta-lactamase class C family)
LVFSSTKGLAAMALAVAHSRGLLDYDEKVAAYWPEFAQNGKAQITVLQLLSHQAGLCAIDTPLDIETLRDLERLSAILARQKLRVEPGAHYAYHVNTLGFYESELLRRIDPHHRSLGHFFHEEVAAPLGLEFYIGLPPEIPSERIATLVPPGPREIRASILQMPLRMILDQFMLRNSLLARAWAQPDISSGVDHTLPENRGIEMPSKNGFGQVRSMAYAYSVFAGGGKELGLRPETIAALSAPVIVPRKGSYDLVLHMQVAYSLGFCKPCPAVRFGLNDRAYGSPGFGGSIGLPTQNLS